MAFWNVPITWTTASSYTIEAATKEEALQIAEERELPQDGEYIGHQLFPDEVTELDTDGPFYISPEEFDTRHGRSKS